MHTWQTVIVCVVLFTATVDPHESMKQLTGVHDGRSEQTSVQWKIISWYGVRYKSSEFNLYQHQFIIFRQNQISISRSEGTYWILLCFKDHCQIIVWKSTLTGSQKFIKSAKRLLQNELRIPLVRNSWASNGLLWSRLRCTRASHSCW